MFKRLLSSFLAAGLLIISIGCTASKAPPAATASPDEALTKAASPVQIPDPGPNGKRVEIVIWHSSGGQQAKAITEIVKRFNESQNKITAVEEYQGDYDAAINKLKASVQANAGPNVMQIYGIGTRWMIDSGYIRPLQEFINMENFDLSDFEKDVLNYYVAKGVLYSMPFNVSTPILLYNKDHFKEAGLDPNKPPKDMDQFIDYSKKLYKKEGNQTRYGSAVAIYGWWFEQWMTKQGLEYANNKNGRDGLATSVVFDDNGGAKKIITKWIELIDSGTSAMVGRSNADARTAFTSGKASMCLASTANLGTDLKAAGGKFDFGVGFFPAINANDPGGVSQGGGSFWIMKKNNPVAEQASYEFAKFAASPDIQAYWAQTTGYIPVVKKAYQNKEYSAFLDANPTYKVAIDQLHAYNGAVGPVLGVFTEARGIVENYVELLVNKQTTIDKAISSMASEIDDIIKRYNASVGK